MKRFSLAMLALLTCAGAQAACEEVQMNLVEAHKWFNIAATRGSEDAARRRRELAVEMSPSEIALAQRQAREWISLH